MEPSRVKGIGIVGVSMDSKAGIASGVLLTATSLLVNTDWSVAV
jgi:hypothetical protein